MRLQRESRHPLPTDQLRVDGAADVVGAAVVVGAGGWGPPAYVQAVSQAGLRRSWRSRVDRSSPHTIARVSASTTGPARLGARFQTRPARRISRHSTVVRGPDSGPAPPSVSTMQ